MWSSLPPRQRTNEIYNSQSFGAESSRLLDDIYFTTWWFGGWLRFGQHSIKLEPKLAHISISGGSGRHVRPRPAPQKKMSFIAKRHKTHACCLFPKGANVTRSNVTFAEAPARLLSCQRLNSSPKLSHFTDRRGFIARYVQGGG